MAGHRVLIVDDTPVLRALLNAVLTRSGYEVVGKAASGREAIDLAQTTMPDIILLDVVMQEMNGIEALPELRSSCPQATIIMLTSTSEAEVVAAARAGGADGYIIKSSESMSREIVPYIRGLCPPPAPTTGEASGVRRPIEPFGG
ncbi:MAG: response regulator [Planctomycetota bacterium]|jgi:DNA-binding NarL/FixJ family response regulator